MIFMIYGDHLYCNNETRLDKDVADDAVWQNWWQHIRNLKMVCYNILLGYKMLMLC